MRPNEISGRLLLPVGIFFFTVLLIPIALYAMPQGRHLTGGLYPWAYEMILGSGIIFGVLILITKYGGRKIYEYPRT